MYGMVMYFDVGMHACMYVEYVHIYVGLCI
jgi:hypothetical protein